MSKKELALQFSKEFDSLSKKMKASFNDSIARGWEVASVIQGAEVLAQDMELLAKLYDRKEPKA